MRKWFLLTLVVLGLGFAMNDIRVEAQDITKNGLVYESIDSTWYYYAGGQKQTQYTGLVQYDSQWFYVQDGVLDTTLYAFVPYDGGIFLVGGGRVMNEVNGLAKDPNSDTWWYLANGQIQMQYTGLAMYDNSWFYVGAGRIVTEANGLILIQDGSWWYMANGQVQTQYTGLVLYDGKWFLVISGRFATDYIGTVSYNGSEFQVVNGQLVMEQEWQEPVTVFLNGNYDTIRGIDVSRWQGEIDFQKVKSSGCEFVMIRIFNGHDKDPLFEENDKKAREAGLKIGVYGYCESSTVEEACIEAQTILEILDGRVLDYPIAMDLEDNSSLNGVTNETRTQMVLAFKEKVISSGYNFILYANYYWLTHYIDNNLLDGTDIWIARYCDTSLGHRYTGGGNVAMWQYSSTGRVDGISGNVDLDYSGYS